MVRYVIRRLALALLIAFSVLVVMAVLVRSIPGDPATAVLKERATPELIQYTRHELGLDLPVHEQIWRFVSRAAHGDLGEGIFNSRPVTTSFAEAAPHTFALAIAAMILATGLAIPLGVLAAARPGSLLDRVLGLTSIFAISIPSLIAALFLLLVFGVNAQLFPTLGAGSFSHPLDYLRHLVLPAIAIAIGWAGYLARLLRVSLIETLGSNYIRTARAFGVRDRVIFFRLALRNAFIPTMAIIGYGVAGLVGGALFVEVIFTRPGVGTLAYQAIQTRDYAVLQGTVAIVSLLFIMVNLIVDLAYRLVDPRVRVEGSDAA